VYTPAVPKDHKQYNYFLKERYTVLKRSEVLGLITSSSFNICVAGTHGKTTTSSMIAHILRHSEFGCNAFLGGIASNYNTNFWSSDKNVCVAEADEYDRSFLRLSPDVAVITAMDPDHLDIYGTSEQFCEAFVEFSSKVKPGGLLINRLGIEKNYVFIADNKISYSAKENTADSFAYNIRMVNGSYHFDAMINGAKIEEVVLNMGGLHNVENVIAAITVAKHLDISGEKIKAAINDFKGVKRRFEYVVKNESMVMIDDYAHHPQELKALITGAKELFPEKKCTIIFQPHLYSRTKDFADGFAEVLSLADEVYLLPIYPARELPIAGVESEMIAKMIPQSKVVCCSKEQLISTLIEKKNANDLGMLITAGAGDIDTLVLPIKKIIE
jgi:UDP-N-acetylmuramate--alanine ligase